MRLPLALSLVLSPLSPLLLPAGVPAAVPGPPALAGSQDDGQQRWLIRMQLSREPVLAGYMDDRRHPMRAWTTPSSAEILVSVGKDLFLVDTRQGRLFQMADAVRDQLEREFQLLFAYPVPRVESPREQPADPVEIVDPGIESRPGLLPTETPLGQALEPPDTRVPLMPNVSVEEYRETWRIAFRVDEREVVLYLEPPTGREWP